MLTDEQIAKILELEYIKSTVYEHDQILVFAFAYDGNFTHVSRSVVKAFGYTKQEMTSGKFIDMVYEEDVERTKDIYSFFGANGKPGYKHFINRYVNAVGDVLNLLWINPKEVKELGVWVSSAILVNDYVSTLNAYDNGYVPFNWSDE